MKKNILLVGESWVSAVNHFKGFDTFTTVSSAVGIKPLAEALEGSDFKLTHMHSQDVPPRWRVDDDWWLSFISGN